MLVHGTPIAPSVMYGVLFDGEAFQREVLDDAQRLLEEVARACKTTGVSSRAEQVPDAPAKALEQVVKDERADYLVVGTQGRGRDTLGARWAASLMRCSQCPRARGSLSRARR